MIMIVIVITKIITFKELVLLNEELETIWINSFLILWNYDRFMILISKPFLNIKLKIKSIKFKLYFLVEWNSKQEYGGHGEISTKIQTATLR